MQISKIRSYVGFAIRSGKVKIGVDNVLSAKKDPFVVLFDPLLKENSKKKLLARCENIPVFPAPMEDIYPNRNCKVIGVCEKNLSKAIIKEMEENS